MMKRRSGFTLAELLIVVAIIGVLVAISIPIFASQLERSKQAVDAANVRNAKAAAVAEYLLDGLSEDVIYYYDSAKGKVIKDSAVGIEGYGKSQNNLNGTNNTINDYADGIPALYGEPGIVAVSIVNGETSCSWVPAGGSKALAAINKVTDDASKLVLSTFDYAKEEVLKQYEEANVPSLGPYTYRVKLNSDGTINTVEVVKKGQGEDEGVFELRGNEVRTASQMLNPAQWEINDNAPSMYYYIVVDDKGNVGSNLYINNNGEIATKAFAWGHSNAYLGKDRQEYSVDWNKYTDFN